MRKRLASAYLSSVFSISLVLLLVSVASLLLVNAGNVADYFKEHLEVSLIFKQEASEAQTKRYFDDLCGRPFVNGAEYVSKEQGIREMEDLLGKDFLSVFDTAPIPVSLNISVKAEYVTAERMDSLMTVLSSSPIVEDVVWQKTLIEKLNSNLRTISLILAAFIVLLTFISFALISNTVRLNLYSKRFTIHTMRLVGATKGFIRAPFMKTAVFQAVISAQLATILLLALLLFGKREFAQLFTIFQLRELLIVMGITFVSGMFICLLSTFVVVGRMVSLKKEELYF